MIALCFDSPVIKEQWWRERSCGNLGKSKYGSSINLKPGEFITNYIICCAFNLVFTRYHKCV
jgi:hypothetical protein